MEDKYSDVYKLSDDEAKVMWHKAHGESNNEICRIFNMGEKGIAKIIKSAHETLMDQYGFTKNTDPHQRSYILNTSGFYNELRQIPFQNILDGSWRTTLAYIRANKNIEDASGELVNYEPFVKGRNFIDSMTKKIIKRDDFDIERVYIEISIGHFSNLSVENFKWVGSKFKPNMRDGDYENWEPPDDD
jgi:hypothetical protein